MNKKINLIIFTAIIFIALFSRLYKINNPVADWHSWRQADTASVTREFVKKGINLLVPTYHDLSSIPSGQPNPNGYRMVEFPVYNAITAKSFTLLKATGVSLNFDLFHRLVSVIFSLASLTYLYLIVKTFSDSLTANFAAFFFAVLPYNIYYSQTILPEIPMVFFTLAFIFHFLVQYKNKTYSIKNPHYWISLIFLSLSLLIKPYALVLLFPLFFLLINQKKLKLFKIKTLYLFIVLSLSPFLAWRFWIQQFPEGIPAYLWLLNANNIRFKGAFFQWIFAERVGRLILGFWGLIIFGFGLIHKKSKTSYYFYLSWLLSVMIYLTTFAAGNVQHDYYQIILIPIISIFLAKGSTYLITIGKKNPIAYLLLITSTLFMLAFSWFEVRGFFNINHPEIVAAGEFANNNTPKDSKIIAPYQGDTAFLYQANRSGWPIGGAIEEKFKAGADYYLTTTQNDEANQLLSLCSDSTKASQFIMINLHSCHFKL